jgi:hypothetical protein
MISTASAGGFVERATKYGRARHSFTARPRDHGPPLCGCTALTLRHGDGNHFQ